MLQNICWIIAWTLLTTAPFVSANANSSFNPIQSPGPDDNAVPGTAFLVTWIPTSTGPISLFVRNFGDTTGVVIANSIPATQGQFNWSVPLNFGSNNTDSDFDDDAEYEMRIYEGSLGLTTTDVAGFETREYSWSSGYFTVSNDTSSFTISVDEFPTQTHQPHWPDQTVVVTNLPITTDFSLTVGAGTTVTASLTRAPTFQAVVSHAIKVGVTGFCMGIMLVIWTVWAVLIV
jgi:hypothetical protein